MDRYLSVRKSTTARPESHHRLHRLIQCYRLSAPKPSSSAITKHLLNTLADESNPITHSNIYERSGKPLRPCSEIVSSRRLDTVVSATTGHQRGERRTPHRVSAKAYSEDRSRKLSLQRENETPRGVLTNVRAYIDGYLSGTTDIEMRTVIAQAGGTTLYVSSCGSVSRPKSDRSSCFRLAPGGATHIVTSRQLSGSKTHRMLSTQSRNPVYVVKPEWVTDSITARRRLKEYHYAPIKSFGTRNIVDVLKSGGSM